MISEAPATVTVPDGTRLEALVAVPAGATAGVVVCHPHPLYGGDMDNPVVVRAVEVAGGLGLATLRFNFRGVGRSTGEHGGGLTEEDDVRAALTELRARLAAPARLILAGFSFGASVSARVAATDAVNGLALIAPPLGISEHATLPALPAALPLLIVVGTRDEYCPLPAIDRLRGELPAARIETIDGANHFFFGTLFPLGEALGAWLGTVTGR